MDKKPLVSIIIPTYNRAEFLPRAVQSALDQTYTNIEIIIVDDCSPDNTKEVVKAYQKKDKRIQYLCNKKNSWACFSRNQWIHKAKWEYIQFLDDDDEISLNKLEKQLNKFEKADNKIWVITCDVDYQRSDIHMVKKNRKKWYIFVDLLKSYCVYATHSMLIKKECFQNVSFDSTLVSWQEYDLMLQILKNWHIDYIPEVLCVVYESKDQISFNFKKKLQWNVRLITKRYKEWIKHKVFVYNIARFSYLLFRYSVWYLFGKKVYLLMP